MRAVNLLPANARARRGVHPAVAVGAPLAGVVVLALGAGYVTAHSRAATGQQRLAEAQAVLGRLQAEQQARAAARAKHAKPIVPPPAVTSEEQPRLAAVSAALSTRIAWDRLLREFALVVPSDITVSSLTMTAPPVPTPGAPAPAPTQGFALGGLAYSHDSVARLLARLMLVPDLTDVTLSNSTADPATGEVTFQIAATVKGAPAPASGATPTGASS